jgi:hypothetical protein
MKALLRRLLDRIAPVREAEASGWDRLDHPPLICPSCHNGYGRIHRCESPDYCDCTNPAVHF